MNGEGSFAQGRDGWGADPATALADAAGLTDRATDVVRASGDVAWECRAAELYRAAVVDVLHALVRDRERLDETMRQASALRATAFSSPGEPGPTGGPAVPRTESARPW
ncbi:hypothetical protein GCM10027063_39180 [Promicromonospora xylanilytica]